MRDVSSHVSSRSNSRSNHSPVQVSLDSVKFNENFSPIESQIYFLLVLGAVTEQLLDLARIHRAKLRMVVIHSLQIHRGRGVSSNQGFVGNEGSLAAGLLDEIVGIECSEHDQSQYQKLLFPNNSKCGA